MEKIWTKRLKQKLNTKYESFKDASILQKDLITKTKGYKNQIQNKKSLKRHLSYLFETMNQLIFK